MEAGLGVDGRQNWPTKAGRSSEEGGGRKDRRTNSEGQAELENRHQEQCSGPDNRSCNAYNVPECIF